MAAEAAPRDQHPGGNADPQERLLLSRVLQSAPPAALIKDDEPLDSDGSPTGKDRFGASNIAEHLGRIIEKAEPPFTISLSGSWGVGKSWVAKRLLAILRSAQIPAVEIDLWTEDVSELRRTLAVEVAVSLALKHGDDDNKEERDEREEKERITQADELDDELRRPEVDVKPPRISFAGLTTRRALVTLLFAAAATVAIVVGVLLPPASSGGPTILATALVGLGSLALVWFMLQSGLVLSVAVPTTTLPPLREAVAIRGKIRRLITAHPDRKVLVVLDNLDRLPGDDAVAALGEVRSFVELPKSRCLFLVPLDREALERHLRKSMGQDAQAARDYLDKFFNLDLLLTKPVAADLRKSMLDLLAELFPGIERESLSFVAEVLADAADGSPRAAKRLANGIYARAYLVPDDSRSQLSLLDVALVEGLLARFPGVATQLADDPNGVVRRIEQVRTQTSPLQRASHLLWLAGDPAEVEGKTPEEREEWAERRWPEVEDLATFLLGVTRDIAPDADVIRTILSARPNRQLVGIPDPKAADAAMRTGNSQQLAEALGGLVGDERRAALTALLEMVRASVSQRFVLGIRAQVNALAPNVGEDEHVAGGLRRVVANYLLSAGNQEFRAFSADTIRFFFARGKTGFPYTARLAQRSVENLAAATGLPIVGAVRFVAAVGDSLDAKGLGTAKEALAKLEDADLVPLFEAGASAKLLPGPVCDKYVTVLAAADWSADLDPVAVAAARLAYAETAAQWDGVAALDAAFTRLATAVSSGDLDVKSLDVVEQVVALAKPMPPQPSRDTLAQALVGFTAGGRRAFELGLEVPATPATMAPVLTRTLNAMPGEDVIALMTSRREQLEERGLNVGEMAATQWAAGNGAGYLSVALDADAKVNLDLVFPKLVAITDPTTYAGLAPGLADRIAELSSADGAQRLLADITTRVTTFGATSVAGMAPSIAKVQHLAVPSAVVSAMSGLLDGVRREEIPMATAAARGFVEAGVTSADELPPVVVGHGAALGTVDLSNLGWLLSQTKVDAEQVIVGLRGAIRTEPQPAVHAALADLRGSRRKRADIGKALAERAAEEDVGDRRSWLEDAVPCHIPSSGDARREYLAALDQAVEGDPDTEAAALELRANL